MPFIEYQQRLYRLREGDNVLGASGSASIQLPELHPDHQLTISVESVGSFAWTTAADGQVALNGRPLDREPVPLFHGDRLVLNGSTLVFIDDGGAATVQMEQPNGHAIPAAVAHNRPGMEATATEVEPDLLRRVTPPEPERRVVAVLRRLDNNQSYIIDQGGFRIGREKRCDLIIPDRSVSRLHAEITFSRGQYLLRDLGRTSTRVNGRKISEPYKLQVGDTVQIGKYEFTFARRPVTAEEIVRAYEITPVRSAVPDAVTVGYPRPGGRRFLSWVVFLVCAGLAALLLLT